MKKSFHTVKKAGILTAAAVLGTAALAGCGSKADMAESAAASEEATEAAGEIGDNNSQLLSARAAINKAELEQVMAWSQNLPNPQFNQ